MSDEPPATSASTLPPLPALTSAADLASHWGVSLRRLKETARRYGCCRIIGNKMLFTAEDATALLEIWKAPPREKVPLRTMARPIGPAFDYASLVEMRERDTAREALEHLERRAALGRRSNRKR